MDTDPKLDREREGENADDALIEVRTTGQTTRRCLRCGGALLVYDAGSGYRVWCENGDFERIVRGI